MLSVSQIELPHVDLDTEEELPSRRLWRLYRSSLAKYYRLLPRIHCIPIITPFIYFGNEVLSFGNDPKPVTLPSSVSGVGGEIENLDSRFSMSLSSYTYLSTLDGFINLPFVSPCNILFVAGLCGLLGARYLMGRGLTAKPNYSKRTPLDQFGDNGNHTLGE